MFPIKKTMSQINLIIKAIKNHETWLDSASYLIENRIEKISPETLRKDNVCSFSGWLRNHISPELKNLPVYNEIVKIHSEFHIEASRTLQLSIDGHNINKEILPDSKLHHLSNELKLKLRLLLHILENGATQENEYSIDGSKG